MYLPSGTSRGVDLLRVAIVEVGAGGHVPTVRNESEAFMSSLLEAGAVARVSHNASTNTNTTNLPL